MPTPQRNHNRPASNTQQTRIPPTMSPASSATPHEAALLKNILTDKTAPLSNDTAPPNDINGKSVPVNNNQVPTDQKEPLPPNGPPDTGASDYYDQMQRCLYSIAEHIPRFTNNLQMQQIEGILANTEHLNSRMDSIINRLDCMRGRMDGIDTRMYTIHARLNDMDTRMYSIDGHVNDVDCRTDGITARTDGIARYMENVARHMSSVSIRINNVNTLVNAIDQRRGGTSAYQSEKVEQFRKQTQELFEKLSMHSPDEGWLLERTWKNPADVHEQNSNGVDDLNNNGVYDQTKNGVHDHGKHCVHDEKSNGVDDQNNNGIHDHYNNH